MINRPGVFRGEMVKQPTRLLLNVHNSREINRQEVRMDGHGTENNFTDETRVISNFRN